MIEGERNSRCRHGDRSDLIIRSRSRISGGSRPANADSLLRFTWFRSGRSGRRFDTRSFPSITWTGNESSLKMN